MSVRDVGCRGGQQTPHCGITGDENGGILFFLFCQFRLLTAGLPAMRTVGFFFLENFWSVRDVGCRGG